VAPMKMARPVAAMVVFVALLFLYLWDVDRSERAVLQDLQQGQVLYRNPTRAIRVEFENEHGRMVLVRDAPDTPWRIAEPRAIPASGAVVDAYLETLRGAKRQARFPSGDAAKYGLDKPARVVRLTTRDESGVETTEELAFGGQPQELGQVYARLSGEEEFFTVSDWFFRQSAKAIEDVRDKSLLPGGATAALRFDIVTRAGTFSVHRPDATSQDWILDRPESESLPADRRIVERLQGGLAAATFLQIFDNPTTSTADLGIDDSLLRLDVDGGEVLRLGSQVPNREQFYARVADGTLGIVPAVTLSDLFRKPAEWGTKRLVWLKRDEIQTLATTSGNTSMQLAIEDGAWGFADAPGLPIRPEAVESLLDGLLALNAMELVSTSVDRDDGVRHGIVEESFRLVANAGLPSEQGFRFGRTDSKRGATYTLREKDNSLWLIDFLGQQNVFKFRKDLMDTRMIPGLAAKTRRVEIESDKGLMVLERTANAWKSSIQGSRPVVIPPAHVDRFLVAFEEMEVESEMIGGAKEPPSLALRLYEANAEKPYATVALLSRTTDRAFVMFGGRKIEISAARFDPFDSELANMLLIAEAQKQKDAPQN